MIFSSRKINFCRETECTFHFRELSQSEIWNICLSALLNIHIKSDPFSLIYDLFIHLVYFLSPYLFHIFWYFLHLITIFFFNLSLLPFTHLTLFTFRLYFASPFFFSIGFLSPSPPVKFTLLINL